MNRRTTHTPAPRTVTPLEYGVLLVALSVAIAASAAALILVFVR